MIDDRETQELAKTQIFQWVSVKVAVVEDNKLLFGKRLDVEEHGAYETPGGKAEVGEDLWEVAVREVEEEVGVKVSQPASQPICVTQNQDKSIVFVCLQAERIGGELLSNTEELAEIRFYSKEEVEGFIVHKQIRTPLIQLAQMFVNGELHG